MVEKAELMGENQNGVQEMSPGAPALMAHEESSSSDVRSPLSPTPVRWTGCLCLWEEGPPLPSHSTGVPEPWFALEQGLIWCQRWAVLFVVGSSTWLIGSVIGPALPCACCPAVSGQSGMMKEVLKCFLEQNIMIMTVVIHIHLKLAV